MKNFILFMLFFLLTENLLAQNVFNPYQNYTGLPMPSYLVPLPAGSSITDFPHSSIISNGFSNYAGEYMIQFEHLPWFKSNSLLTFSLAKSYKLEVVGFPFVMNCAETSTGCADGLTFRNLEMPDNQLLNDKWGINVWRMRDNITINLNSPKPLGEKSNLITNAFMYNHSINAFGATQPFYPHTIHKFTVYLHCGTSISSSVVDSLEFYYDHTRGRMRDYPFTIVNTSSGFSGDWDVVFRPRLLYQNYDDGHYYNKSYNEDLYNRGNTINYFPFIADLGGCNQQSSGNLYYDAMNDAFYGMHPAPYTLTTFLLYHQYTYNQFAGYNLNNGILILNEGVRHTYHIQNNIDLTLINPDEKVIYNPSEVHVTADNLIFPSYYTFKTIRGVYPTEAEVLADYTPENGCSNISDLRQVPVRTDLRTDVTGYPNNPAVEDHSVYASIYYLEPGSKLTIAECAKIFDAYFEVKQGASLIFNDHSQVAGVEDKSYNSGRYKIKGTGGAVLRNNAEVQYVQNGIISQPHPLHYIARQTLEAGDAVDPDTDQPQGNYDVQTGADVTFEAGDVIHLTNGFQVSGGNFSAFTSSIIPDFPVCYDALRIMPNQPKDNKQKPQATMQDFTISPNPSSTGIFNIRFRNLPVNGELSVFNAMGIEVKRIDNILQNSLTVSLEGLAKGIYMFRYRENEIHETKKVVYE